MELKVLCDCGQKFAFNVEPVNGRMPTTITCPACNEDATAKANELISQQMVVSSVVADAPPALAPLPPATGGLRIQHTEAPPSAPPVMSATGATAPPPLSPAAVNARPNVARPAGAGQFNLGLGILGAFIGAAVGAGLMYGFFEMANFRFPLMGTGIGALTGLGARLMYRGTGSTLGFISAGIAVLGTCGGLYFIYGDVNPMFGISIALSGYFAYRVAG